MPVAVSFYLCEAAVQIECRAVVFVLFAKGP